MTKLKTRGGARPNSGRKKTGLKAVKNIKVDLDNYNKIKIYCIKNDKKITQVINLIIKNTDLEGLN
jgi:nitrogen regulatory protein PII